MKTCTKCGGTKPRADFYSRGAACKECIRAAARAYRASNIDRVREYDRQRGLLPDRKARVAANRHRYKKTAEDTRRHRANHPGKSAAHSAVNRALRLGKLKRWPCERCGTTEGVQAHHDDYSRPFDVKWLCPGHHGERHRELNEMRRQIEKAA